MKRLPDIYFDNYEAFTEKEILSVTAKGITLRNGMYIDFNICAENFKMAYPDISDCVGEMEVADLSFTFYAAPRAIMISFSYGDSRTGFNELQSTIQRYGYQIQDIL